MPILSVTENVIPFDRAEECFRRIGPKRKALMADVETAYLRFVDAEADMRFMHTRTVQEAQQSLADLIAACKAYSQNLDWNLK